MSTDATATMAPPPAADDLQQEPQLAQLAHSPPQSETTNAANHNQPPTLTTAVSTPSAPSALSAPPLAPPAPHAPPATVDPNDITMKDPQGHDPHSQKPIGLHSPPDSNNAMKLDDSDDDSELSDLDDAAIGIDLPDSTVPAAEPQSQPHARPDDVEEDIGEIFPDHWSGTVPVFKPNMHQFKDFKKFMEKVDSYGMKSGIIKIIPPEEWKEKLPVLDELVKQVTVRQPIKQEIMGSNGTYRQVNILHQRSYNLPQWRQLCDQSEHQPPARRGERRAHQEKPKTAPRTRATAAATAAASTTSRSSSTSRRRGRGGRGRGRTRSAKDSMADLEDRPMTPVSPKPSESVIESVEQELGAPLDEDEADMPRGGRMGAMKQAKSIKQSTSARRKYARREASARIDEEAFKEFDYKMDISDYTPERCEELERIYWKTLTYAPPLYGADLPGTLFDEDCNCWNLSKLPNLLDVLGTKVPGVNTAYLYLGMWKSTFAWHLEDVDLYSINYLHFGAPKQWYSISQGDARRFEAAMKNIWPTDAKACDQFLRHKAFLISPNHLQQNYNIKVNKCVSYPGEFVVTYPYGYHSGYNLGYNCAEAVNFALDSWLPMGKIAKKCECAQAQDSVWVDVYEIERKLRGESTDYEETEDEEDDEEEDEDEDDEEEDDPIPTPRSTGAVRFKQPVRKRKRAPVEKGERKAGRKIKKVRLRVKNYVEPPCCLCPHDIAGLDILPTDDGRKAHRLCALYGPETWIETVDGKEVANVADMSHDRLNLKCLYCRSKKGACFRCAQKKCARSYHATCAAAAGVLVEEGEVPIFSEDGTEYKEKAYEFSCRFHRTKRDRKRDSKVLDECQKTRQAAAAVKKGELCQLQYHRGEIFAGLVVENRTDEETFLLDVIPNGDRVEVEWKWLLLQDPADYHLPKASANAIPMPTSRRAREKIKATKRQTEEIPRADEPFVDGFTWSEFNTCKPNTKMQAKVDLSKENQLWYYLGRNSTEARAQYTDNPKSSKHNPRSNFLDTIPRPPPAPPQPRKSFAGFTFAAHLQGGPRPTKTEKPYEYKPKNPITPSFVPSPYTSQQFVPPRPAAPYTPQHVMPKPPQPQYPQPQHSLPQQALFTPQQFVPKPNYLSSGFTPKTAPAKQTAPKRRTPKAQQPRTQQPLQARPPPPPHQQPPPLPPPPPQSQPQWQQQQQQSPFQAQQPIHTSMQQTPKPPQQAQQVQQISQTSQSQPSQPDNTAQPQPIKTPRAKPSQGGHTRNSQSLNLHRGPSRPFGPDSRFRTSSFSYGSGRFESNGKSPFSHGFTQPPGLGPSPSPQNGQLFQAQARARSSSSASTKSFTAPMTSSVIRPSSSASSQGTGMQAQAAQPQAQAASAENANKSGTLSVVQKYAFFQVHHNRDSTKYRTPYAPWGGFTNGYEGNLRAHLMRTPDALFGMKRPSFGSGSISGGMAPSHRYSLDKDLSIGATSTPSPSTSGAHMNHPQPLGPSQPVASPSTPQPNIGGPFNAVSTPGGKKENPPAAISPMSPWDLGQSYGASLHPALQAHVRKEMMRRQEAHDAQLRAYQEQLGNATSATNQGMSQAPHVSTPTTGAPSASPTVANKITSIPPGVAGGRTPNTKENSKETGTTQVSRAPKQTYIPAPRPWETIRKGQPSGMAPSPSTANAVTSTRYGSYSASPMGTPVPVSAPGPLVNVPPYPATPMSSYGPFPGSSGTPEPYFHNPNATNSPAFVGQIPSPSPAMNYGNEPSMHPFGQGVQFSSNPPPRPAQPANAIQPVPGVPVQHAPGAGPVRSSSRGPGVVAAAAAGDTRDIPEVSEESMELVENIIRNAMKASSSSD